MTTHAPFAPSGLATIVACPGAFKMRKLYPEDEDSPSAMEGTAAHWVASEMLLGRTHAAGELAPNGVAVTEEMLDGAEMYADALAPYLDGAKIETPVSCASIHADCYGTPDFSRLRENTLIVADYKFGHRHVEVFENWQLLAYAAGEMFYWHGEGELEIIFLIIQPRSYHRDGPVREWRMPASELPAYVERLRAACIAAEQPDAPCVPSIHCQDCSASHACPALQNAAYSALDIAGQSAPLELTPEATGLELRIIEWAIERLKARQSGLSEQAQAMLRSGTSVPGYALEAGTGREKWAKSVEEVIALGGMMGVNVSKPGVITPKQAIKAGLPAEIVRAYSETPVGEVKLVRSNEKQLRKVFSINHKEK